MLKILQARLQHYMNHELLDVQAGFRKDRGTKDQNANILCIMTQRDGMGREVGGEFRIRNTCTSVADSC